MNRYLLETILIFAFLVIGMKAYLIIYNLRSFQFKSTIHASVVVIYIAGLLWITMFFRSRYVSSSASFDFCSLSEQHLISTKIGNLLLIV